VFRVQQCTDQNHIVREGIQKYIDEHNATLNEDDVRDFIDAYLLDIRHHKHGLIMETRLPSECTC
jgi:hypothetical protein